MWPSAHICISKITIIGSDDGLSPGQCQAIIQTNAGILFIHTLGTNFSEKWNIKRNACIFIQENAFKNIICKMAAILSRPQCVKIDSSFPIHIQDIDMDNSVPFDVQST